MMPGRVDGVGDGLPRVTVRAHPVGHLHRGRLGLVDGQRRALPGRALIAERDAEVHAAPMAFSTLESR
jgi:hypothetical protein